MPHFSYPRIPGASKVENDRQKERPKYFPLQELVKHVTKTCAAARPRHCGPCTVPLYRFWLECSKGYIKHITGRVTIALEGQCNYNGS